MVTLFGAMVWAFFGPHLVLASVVASLLAFLIQRSNRSRATTTLTVLAVLALLSSTWITAAITRAAHAAGVSVNPLATLALENATYRPDDSLVYKEADGQKLLALVFKPATKTVGAPVLLMVHGGGWVSGKASDYNRDAHWYAQRGWLVVSLDYRLAAPSNPTWDKAPADVACGLSWTAAHAAAWGGDPQKIVVMGGSAGGNLALNLGWSAAIGKPSVPCPTAGPVPVPVAVIAQYPVANPGYTYEHGRQWFFNQHPRNFTNDYLGGTPAQYPERLAAISSATYISAAAPPRSLFRRSGMTSSRPPGTMR